ncbi:MAG: hypothetical protein ACK481_09070 [Candidatus Melainabacteria bacterium]|jgi:hypothetical protein
MKKLFFVFCAFLISLTGLVRADEVNPLPFKVKVAGQEAKVKSPVSASADLEFEVKDKSMIIINIFPFTDRGIVDNAAKPKIILVNQSNKTKLNKTMDKAALQPGNYLMNVVADQKSSRILFEVK